jgi:phosphodiesterase/alkaline phosphatase D-like protein
MGHISVIGKGQPGESCVRSRAARGPGRAFQALLLGLLAPLAAAAFAAPPAAPKDPLTPIVNLHDAYLMHGGSFLLGGSASLDRFGEGMATGDYTGDGVADLAVGRPAGSIFSGPRSGLLYPFQGSSAGPTQGRSILYGADGAGGTRVAGDDFGAAIAVGDFDDNGIDDVAVAAPGKVPTGAAHAGMVFVFHSTGFFLADDGSLTEETAGGVSAEGDEFGRAMAAGDFNGDGFADLAVGAPGKTTGGQADAGAIFLFPGSASGPVAGSILTEAAFAQPPQDGDRFGAALVTGDFNGDGRTDLAVGIPGKKVGTADNAGVVAVLYGSAAGLVAGPRLAQEQALQLSEADDGFGASIASGNFDNDSRDDLFVAAPAEDQASSADAGMVCPFLGLANGFLQRPCLFENGTGAPLEAQARFGAGLASADLDGDGRDDLAVGAPGSALGGAAGAGALFVYASLGSGFEAHHTLFLQDAGGASQAGDSFGGVVVMADFNGDGTADIAAAATADAPPNQANGGTVSFFPGLSSQVRRSSGPMIGAVTDTSIKIWGRSDRPASLSVEFKPAGTPWPGTISGSVSLTESSDFTGTVELTGLVPDSGYESRLLLDDVVQPGSESSFRTLETPGPGRVTRFALGADFEFGQDPYAILSAVAARQPDFTLFVGDQIYADEPSHADLSLQGYARRYRENWGEEFLAEFLADQPTFMMWDDHDIEDNWSSGIATPYVFARQAFDRYQGAHRPPPRVAGELSYAFEAGDAAFYMLDVRTHRSSNAAPDTASKTMLGSAVKADLKAWLSTTPARFKFVISPVMWNNHGTTGNDSWFGFQTERQEILDYIRSNHICGVVLLSGDQHWSGVFRLDQSPPYHFYELSPTPLGNSNRPMTADTGSDILFKSEAGKVYGFVTADSTANPPRVTLDIHNAADTRIYQLILNWSDLCPDSDGDAVLDDVDCSPDNPAVWSRPAEVTLQFQSNNTTLQWSASASPGGMSQPVYDLLSSGSRSDFSAASATCLLTNGTSLSASDATIPPVGQGRYYLVRSENLCGGTLEVGSNGELTGRTCP